jgi:multidrug efflux system outer membrane protein
VKHLAAIAGFLLLPASVHAQTAPSPAPAGARPGVPVLAPTLSALPPPAPGVPVEAPKPPQVDDPMLTPVPPANRLVSSWKEALEMLAARSLDLRNAADQILSAEAQSRIALAAALPTLTGLGSGTHNFITNTIPAGTTVAQVTTTGQVGISEGTRTPTPNYLNGSLALTQPLLAIEAWHTIGTAHVSEDVARFNADDLRRTLAISVGTDLVNVVAAERVAELNRVALENALQQLVLTQTKARHGAANGLDIARIQQTVDTARAAIVTGDESLRQAREALGLALGDPQQMGVPPSFSLNDVVTGAGSSCRPVDKLQDRKDILALRTQEVVAKRNVDDVYEQFLPTINATSTLGTTTLNTGAAPATTWNIQGLLTVPIWDGGARYGNLHNMQALLDEAKNATAQAERNATIAVLQARRGVEVAVDAERVAEQARATDANIDKWTRQMFQTGGAALSEAAISSLDVQLAAEVLREAEINLAVKQAATQQAKLTEALTLSVCHW